MSSKGKNPHNALVLDTFSQTEHAASLLEALIPQSIGRHLDLSSLELSSEHLVDEKLRELETDLLYRVALVGEDVEDAFVYVLLEHQSTVDSMMIFRLLKYMVRIWDRWLRHQVGAKTLPPIIPLVLSNAEGSWTGKLELAAIIDGPDDFADALRPHLPSFEPLLEHLSDRPDGELLEMKLTALARLVMILLKHIRDGDLERSLGRWSWAFRDVMQGSGQAALLRVLMYTLEASEIDPVAVLWEDDSADFPIGDLTMSTAERLREEGRREGREEGRRTERRAILLKQLELRFSTLTPEAESRIRSATPSELEGMIERVLTADDLDGVLEAKRPGRDE